MSPTVKLALISTESYQQLARQAVESTEYSSGTSEMDVRACRYVSIPGKHHAPLKTTASTAISGTYTDVGRMDHCDISRNDDTGPS